jgi:hypothetical protein
MQWYITVLGKPVPEETVSCSKLQTHETSEGFELAIPTIERPQTYASDRTATKIGYISLSW